MVESSRCSGRTFQRRFNHRTPRLPRSLLQLRPQDRRHLHDIACLQKLVCNICGMSNRIS